MYCVAAHQSALPSDRSISPTADWIARQITEAFPWDAAPGYLIRDRDCVFGSIVRHRVCAMGIRDKPIAPRSPWLNRFRRAPDWVYPSRMPGPDHCLQRGASAPDSALLRELLQRSSDAPVTKQRRAGASSNSAPWRPKVISCFSVDCITNTSKSRFQYRQGVPVADLCRKHGISHEFSFRYGQGTWITDPVPSASFCCPTSGASSRGAVVSGARLSSGVRGRRRPDPPHSATVLLA